MDSENTIFFSYSRDDSEFVLDLAKNLRKAGADIWLDQLDISPGTRWDSSIEKALSSSKTLLVILSASSVKSHNVMDEVSYALEEHKTVVPILLEECEIPFRLRRLQYADFSGDYKNGVATLIKALNLDKNVAVKLAGVAIDDQSEANKAKEEMKIKTVPQADIKKTVAPPKQQDIPIQKAQPISTSPTSKPAKKNNNSLIIGGIIGGGLLLLLIIFMFAGGNEQEGVYDEYPEEATVNSEKGEEITKEVGIHKGEIESEVIEEKMPVEKNNTSIATNEIVKETKSAMVENDTKTEIKTNENQIVVNGLNVRKVEYLGGYFQHVSGKDWIEKSSENNSQFNFIEVGRDDWSVYLLDEPRDISIQLNLHRKTVYIDYENPNGGEQLYLIIGSKK